MRPALRRKPIGIVILLFSFIILLWTSILAWYLYSNTPSAPSTSGSHLTAFSFSPETAVARPKVTPEATLKRPNFETGVVSPQWLPGGYGSSQWHGDLQQIQTQTAARWIEMPLLFQQPSYTSTAIAAGQTTPTIASFVSGILSAHSQGFRVFVVPLVKPWAGTINFSNSQDEQQWFTNYWQAYRPYILAAAQNKVEQLAIGTEDTWLQQNAPDTLWNNLIANVHSIFPGTLTYDMNWVLQVSPLPSWMKNSYLKLIGFSEYIPQIPTSTRVAPQTMQALWTEKVKPIIDDVAQQLGKPIFISEIGFRNSSDALYQPYQTTTTAPADPAEQEAACDAALANAIHDPNITGIFFWGWDNVGIFNLKGLPAASVLHKWFTSPEA